MATKANLICCILAGQRPDGSSDHVSLPPSREATPAAVRRRKSITSVKNQRECPPPVLRAQTPPQLIAVENDSSRPDGSTEQHVGNVDSIDVPRSKSRKVAAFLKRKLSKTKTAAHNETEESMQEKSAMKHQHRKSLLSEVHGYDPDATALGEIVDDNAIDVDEEYTNSPSGGKKTARSEKRRSTLPSRHSEPLVAEPREARRSQSLYSLVSIPKICAFNDIRLPSFSAVLTSKTWRQSLMEELHIYPPTPQSRVQPALITTKENIVTQIEALKPSQSLEVAANHRDLLNPQLRFTAAVEALHNRPDRSSPTCIFDTADQSAETEEAMKHQTEPQLIEDVPRAVPRAQSPKLIDIGAPNGLGNPIEISEAPRIANDQVEVSPVISPENKAVIPTVHLQNMQISRHLRSDSGATTRAQTRVNTRVNSSVSQTLLDEDLISLDLPNKPIEKRHCPSKNLGFGSEEVPASWGKPLRDDASSTCSDKNGRGHVDPLNNQRSDLAELAKSCATRPDVETPSQEQNLIRSALGLAGGDDSALGLPFLPFPPASTALVQFVVADEINCYAGLQEEPLMSDKQSTSTLGKESKFKEELDMQSAKTTGKRRSLLSLFRYNRKENKSQDNITDPIDHGFDGSSEGPQQLKRATPLSHPSGATGLMAAAIQHNVNEKSALFLGPHKDQAEQPSIRQRSVSMARPASAPGMRPSLAGGTLTSPQALPVQRSRTPFLTPSFGTVDFSGGLAGDGSSIRRQSVMMGPHSELRELERKQSATPMFQLNDKPAELGTESPLVVEKEKTQFQETVDRDLGPWARYPTRGRHERSGSAGKSDGMIVRDFAPDREFQAGRTSTDTSVDTGSDGKKSLRQRLTGARSKTQRTGLQKSRSMVFAKDVIKNYARHILAPNTDFLKHGHGHRTSISTGGDLAHPELELLPPIFGSGPRIEEDLGLEPIELVSMANSDAGDLANRHRRLSAAMSRFDGAVESPTPVLANNTRRQASEPLVGASPRVEQSIKTRSNSNPFWSNRYASCVFLPRTSIDETFIDEGTTIDSPGSLSIDSTIPLLVNEVLSRSASCTSHHSLPGKFANTQAPAIDPKKLNHGRQASQSSNYSQPNGVMTSGLLIPNHVKRGSGSSSLRNSSVNLLAMLKETEERERQKLMGAIGGTSESKATRDLSEISLLVGPPSLVNMHKP